MTQLVALESGLAISQPIAATVKRAYTYTPDRQSALPDTPCWINEWAMPKVEMLMGNSNADQYYTVKSQLLVLDADLSRAADIATAFHVALVTAWEANVFLTNSVSLASLRGADPTLALLEWAGLSYVGLNVIWDLSLYQ